MTTTSHKYLLHIQGPQATANKEEQLMEGHTQQYSQSQTTAAQVALHVAKHCSLQHPLTILPGDTYIENYINKGMTNPC